MAASEPGSDTTRTGRPRPASPAPARWRRPVAAAVTVLSGLLAAGLAGFGVLGIGYVVTHAGELGIGELVVVAAFIGVAPLVLAARTWFRLRPRVRSTSTGTPWTPTRRRSGSHAGGIFFGDGGGGAGCSDGGGGGC
ncbi:hypothetical protein H7X46_18710 [Pseudonocardia sp. C8]|uniref:hypothetical protein n=1 Tax=Pseudonocardia sp. C8 TaxID=2762759 RepID=UPI0016431CA8|nr:hypothetical protein [Pseudonocardia sp. C8]MBC3193095.1 hypothetical protein [Pseudonocardia sp. C8]